MQKYLLFLSSIVYSFRTQLLCFFTFLHLFAVSSQAQTTLVAGDIAVVGVNANNAACVPSGSAGDYVSFICFKNITTNTAFTITDNGYNYNSSGNWYDAEGTYNFIYTGATTIPAGTIITIFLPTTGTPSVVQPNTTWTVVGSPVSPTAWGLNVLNINSGGDQFSFIYPAGGTWSNPAGTGNAALPAGATVLYMFNTAATWTAPTGTGTTATQNSSFYPGIECNSLKPNAGTDFMLFTGAAPADPTNQLSWIEVLRNPVNWTSYAGCAAYNSAFLSNSAFAVSGTPPYTTPASITLAPKLFTNTITTSLSATGVQTITPTALCASSPGTATVDLTQYNNSINGTQSYSIQWYTGDPNNGGMLITTPSSYTVSNGTILWAAQQSQPCNTTPITFSVNSDATASLNQYGLLCEGAVAISQSMSITAPATGVSIQWYDGSNSLISGATGTSYTPIGAAVPSATTTYNVVIASPSCSTTVTVPLYVIQCESNCQFAQMDTIPPTFLGGADGSASVVFLPPQLGTFDYSWNTGATTQTISNLSAGTYQVTVTGSGTIASDPITTSDGWTFQSGFNTSGTNGATPNAWFINATEPGHAPNSCGGPPLNGDVTLHIVNVSSAPTGNGAAEYNTSMASNQVAISPTYDLSGYSGSLTGSGIQLCFDYMEVSQSLGTPSPLDNMNVYISSDAGTTWHALANPPTTYQSGCTVGTTYLGHWEQYCISLPAFVNDNPNVKLAFNWVNNADGRWGANQTKTSQVSTAINNIVFSLDCNATLANTLSPGPSPSLTLGASDPTPCAGETITLTATATPPAGHTITSYEWSANTTGGNAATTTASPTVNTVYTVTVTDNFNDTTTATLSIVVSSLPTVVISGANNLCNGESTVLNAGSGYNSYTWSNGSTTQTINVSTTGTYAVTVSNANGCTGADTISVSALSGSTTISGATSFCIGTATTLSAEAGFASYSWSNGFSSQTITTDEDGIYTVTVTAANGCTGTATTTVTLLIPPTATATNNGPVCEGTTATLSASGGTAYTWLGLPDQATCKPLT